MHIAAFALMCLLQVGDVISTIRFLRAGKREANPLIRWLMDKIGVWPTMILKLAATFAAAWVLCFAVPEYLWLMAPLCAVYAYTVWRNWRVVK